MCVCTPTIRTPCCGTSCHASQKILPYDCPWCRPLPSKTPVLDVLMSTDRQAKRLAIVTDILAERTKQDAQWGGPTTDDTRTTEQWLDYIYYQMKRWDSDETRSKDVLTKIAALALAALESLERQKPSEHPVVCRCGERQMENPRAGYADGCPIHGGG